MLGAEVLEGFSVQHRRDPSRDPVRERQSGARRDEAPEMEIRASISGYVRFRKNAPQAVPLTGDQVIRYLTPVLVAMLAPTFVMAQPTTVPTTMKSIRA